MHLLKIIILVGCISLLSGCDQPPPTSQAVEGRYQGDYGTTQEIIEMRRDGTFDQTLSWKDQVIHNKGSWKVDQLGLAFFHIYIPFEVNGGLLPAPRLSYNASAVWVNHNGFRRIAFDIDHGYVLDQGKP